MTEADESWEEASLGRLSSVDAIAPSVAASQDVDVIDELEEEAAEEELMEEMQETDEMWLHDEEAEFVRPRKDRVDTSFLSWFEWSMRTQSSQASTPYAQAS